MKNAIVKRKYYALEIELDAPLNVSGGDDVLTDADILRNARQEVFIPGSSISGALRNYLKKDKQTPCVFGYSQDEEGFMSKIYISDLYFEEGAKTSVRDGIRLDTDKIMIKENKFDQEIIETGARGILYLSYLIRSNDSEEEIDAVTEQLLLAIQAGEIRFGARKTRGFGKMRIHNIYEKAFTKGELKELLDFLSDEKDISKYDKKDFNSWEKEKQKLSRKYLTISIPLKQEGGISIRRYSAKPEKADFEHITCNGKPVIPGSGWNGAIRSAAAEILEDLGCQNAKEKIKQWFGYVEANEARQSRIVISESVLHDAKEVPITRNKINRFDASTVDGALYSEVAYFNGWTTLHIHIQKDEKKEYLALAGLMEIIINDIRKGYLPVGGQTAVGRGIFTGNGDIVYSEPPDESLRRKALYAITD